MNILRHVTKQFGTRLALRSLNVHRLGSSKNYVCERRYQEPLFSVLGTKNGLCSKYIWSKSYAPQVSTRFKVVLERLKDRNVPQVEAALESEDFKKRVFELVSYYYDFENKSEQKEVGMSMSVADLYQIHAMKKYYGFVSQVGEHLSKSDSFKNLLETLPDHVEKITIGDQLDIYMGLLLLGVEETNLSMNHLFCNFYKTDSMLGLSELAKIKLLLSVLSNHIYVAFYSIYTPNIGYLIKNSFIQNQEDCKSLALCIYKEKFTSNLFFNISNQMLFYTAHSNLTDLDFILRILNAFFSCSFKWESLTKSNKLQTILRLLTKIMNQLEPQIETLTSSQIIALFLDLGKDALIFLHMNYPKIFGQMCAKLAFSLEKVLMGDMPLEEKLDYLYTLSKLYSVNQRILTSENKEKMLQFIIESTPGAKIATLFSFVNILLRFRKHRQTNHVLNCLLNETLNILLLQPTFHMQIDGVNIPMLLDNLLTVRPWVFNELYSNFAPYVKWFIQSGHACSSSQFFRICKIAIPVLGNNMPSTAEERIRNQILLMNVNEHIFYKESWYNIRYIYQGTLLEYTNTQSEYADGIIQLLTKSLKGHRFDTKLAFKFLRDMHCGPIKSASISDLQKTIADRVEVNQSDFAYLSTSKNLLPYISERNANTLLRYSALAYFNGKHMGVNWLLVLYHLMIMFTMMSRYPKDKKLLDSFSKSIFDECFKDLHFHEIFRLLHGLCSLGIYLDQYIQIFFSREYLSKMDKFVVEQTHGRKRDIYGLFALLNREVVLHRQQLNIPWISNPLVNSGYHSKFEKLLQETVEFDQVKNVLNEVLGESTFLATHVTGEYGIDIDFEFFLDSSNKPMEYKTAKEIHHSKSDIQKIAVIIGRKTTHEYLAENANDPSVYNTNKIKDLNALGYKAVLIQGHEWDSLIPGESYRFLKEKIFGEEMN